MVLSCLVCCHSRACMLTPKQAPKCILKVILLGYSSYVVNFRIKKKKKTLFIKKLRDCLGTFYLTKIKIFLLKVS